jgi:hypothetical protein
MFVTRSRAAHTSPAGPEDVVVDAVDELPVDDVVPVVGVVLGCDEHAPSTNAATATVIAPDRARKRARDRGRDGAARCVVHRRDRCGAEVLRS